MRLLTQVVSVVVVAVVGYLANALASAASGAGSGEGLGGHLDTSHTKAVRSMVVGVTDGPGLDDIGGYESVKTDLRRSVVVPMRHPRVFFDSKAPSLRPPPGILLAGPPGTGKTLLARACAKESGVHFLPLHSAALESKWWGESPKLLQAAFRLARTTLSPCIIFFDEIDGIGRCRSEQDQSCVYTFKCELLRNIDGLDKGGGGAAVTVLACTNCPDRLDPALRRRFPRTIHVQPPTCQERRAILGVVTRGEAFVDEALLDRVAAHTKGMTGADLSSLYSEACAHRLWRTCAHEEDVGSLTNGLDLVARMAGLTGDDWQHTGRIALPHQSSSPVVTAAATATDDPVGDTPVGCEEDTRVEQIRSRSRGRGATGSSRSSTQGRGTTTAG